MKKQGETWAVVGGGILGMSTALRLARQGKKVRLFEAEPQIGGLTSCWELDGLTWDKFYHVILKSDQYTRELLKELKLEDEIKWVETKTGFYSDGKLYSMSNTLEFLKFPPLNIIDKLRLGFTIFYASRIKNWKNLEKVQVADWLTRLSGKRTFNKMWLPLLRAKLGDSYSETSAAFIWATIQRMYAARRSGLKKEMFGYVPGGYARILKAFEDLLLDEGVEINTGHKTESVIKKAKGPFEIRFTNKAFAEAEKVVLTIPSTFIPKICPTLPGPELAKHHAIRYLGVICLSLTLKRPVSSFYVTNITDKDIPFTGVIEMTALVEPSELQDKNLIYLPKYASADDPIFSEDDESIKKRFINGLLDMYPELSQDDIIFGGLARAKNVFALSTLDYSTKLPPMISSVKNLFFINSAYITNGTLNVNETIKMADESVKEICTLN